MRGVLKVTPSIIFVLECAYTFLQIFECSLLSKLETITPTLEPVLCDPKSEQCCIVEIISYSLWYKFSVNNYLGIVFADKTWNFHKHPHFEAVLGDPNSDQCCMQLAIRVLEYQRIDSIIIAIVPEQGEPPVLTFHKEVTENGAKCQEYHEGAEDCGGITYFVDSFADVYGQMYKKESCESDREYLDIELTN